MYVMHVYISTTVSATVVPNASQKFQLNVIDNAPLTAKQLVDQFENCALRAFNERYTVIELERTMGSDSSNPDGQLCDLHMCTHNEKQSSRIE